MSEHSDQEEREISLEPASPEKKEEPSTETSSRLQEKNYRIEDLEVSASTRGNETDRPRDDYRRESEYRRGDEADPRRESRDDRPKRYGSPKRRQRGGYSIYIRNVHHSVSERRLRDMFERFGIVHDVYIPKDIYSRRPKGFAYVEMERFDDFKNAIRELDRKVIEGKEISVEEAKGRRKTRDEMRDSYSRRIDRFDFRKDSPRRRYPDSPQHRYSPRRSRYSPGPPSPYEDRRRDYPRYRSPPRDYPDPKRRRYSPEPPHDSPSYYQSRNRSPHS